eukprot:12087235-Alexandrium_andersonii.AAC.1
MTSPRTAAGRLANPPNRTFPQLALGARRRGGQLGAPAGREPRRGGRAKGGQYSRGRNVICVAALGPPCCSEALPKTKFVDCTLALAAQRVLPIGPLTCCREAPLAGTTMPQGGGCPRLGAGCKNQKRGFRGLPTGTSL